MPALAVVRIGWRACAQADTSSSSLIKVGWWCSPGANMPGSAMSVMSKSGVQCQGDLGAHVGDFHLGHHQPQVLNGSGAAVEAIADEPGRLVVPLGEQEVDSVLQRRGHGVVVLGRHEHEPVEGGDRLSPPLGVRVLVVADGGGQRFVEQGQFVVGQVDDLEGGLPTVVGSMVGRHLMDPAGYEFCSPARTGASDDDGDPGHGWCSSCV